MDVIKNIHIELASELIKKWVSKDKDNYVSIASSAFPNCYRLNLWYRTKIRGLHRIKSSYRVMPD